MLQSKIQNPDISLAVESVYHGTQPIADGPSVPILGFYQKVNCGHRVVILWLYMTLL